MGMQPAFWFSNARAGREAKWTLKQVQGDGAGFGKVDG